MASISLLGSVFLPASVLEPFARELTRRGHAVGAAVPHVAASVAAVLDGYAAGIRPGSVLVAHSNAGNFVPALMQRTSAVGAVFLDAVLPPFDGGAWNIVPPQAAARVRATARGGMLPRWTRWWPREDAAALFPSAGSFDETDAGAPEVPAAYLDLVASAEPGWSEALPVAYLALSEGYTAELQRAADRGWPTARLELGHLGMLRSPHATSVVVDALLGQL